MSGLAGCKMSQAPSEPSSRCRLRPAAQKGALTQVATKPVFGDPEPPAL